MGFFRNLFDEAGSKTGRAIGNALFPNTTDYIRLGDLDMDHNLNVLAQLETILESLPRRFDRSHEEQQLYKAALAKMKAGIALCRSKDPENEALTYFADKY